MAGGDRVGGLLFGGVLCNYSSRSRLVVHSSGGDVGVGLEEHLQGGRCNRRPAGHSCCPPRSSVGVTSTPVESDTTMLPESVSATRPAWGRGRPTPKGGGWASALGGIAGNQHGNRLFPAFVIEEGAQLVHLLRSSPWWGWQSSAPGCNLVISSVSMSKVTTWKFWLSIMSQSWPCWRSASRCGRWQWPARAHRPCSPSPGRRGQGAVHHGVGVVA